MNQMDDVPIGAGPTTSEDGRRTRHDARRAEIINSAIDYVFDNGLSDLSVRPLAAALGISHRTLLYHFGSKEALISRVLYELRNRKRLDTELEAMEDDAAPVDLMWSVWERFGSPEHEGFFRFFFEVWGTALQHPDDYPEFLDDVVEGWVGVFEKAFATSELAGYHPRDLATLFVASVRGLFLDLLTTGDRARVERAFELLVNAVNGMGQFGVPERQRSVE